MDASQTIQRDHREVERLFKELERAERAERKGELVRELVRALSVHATIEEQLVYPALRRAGADGRVLDALEEHHAVKLTLAELEHLPPAHERYGAKVRLLSESVRRHVAEEERELLPLLERSLDAGRNRQLTAALDRARRVAPTRPHPAAPDTPPGNLVAGAFAAVYDRIRDALRGGGEVIRTILAQGASRGLDAAKGLAARARRRSREAVDGAVDLGRAAASEAADRGREVMGEARAAAGRLELRGSEAAREVARRGRGAARAGRKGARTASRGSRAGARGRRSR